MDAASVTGLTHTFYRYPARFSPQFVRAAINTFSKPGDCVLDPFVGGGTTLVEAMSMGRDAIGTDISPLASFITEAKTTLLTDDEATKLATWVKDAKATVAGNQKAGLVQELFSEAHYKRNLGQRATWRIKKAIEQTVASAATLGDHRLENFARSAILRTAQWAIDGRKEFPSLAEFRLRLESNLCEMLAGTRELRLSVERGGAVPRSLTLNRSAVGLESEPALRGFERPKLVVTSPPYPGVHVLYHRWQLSGGKETAVPFWIAKKLDGKGASFYTMGDRKERSHDTYFSTVRDAFSSVAAVCDPQAIIVQMVAFASPEDQLPRYLHAMHEAGLRQAVPADESMWRSVPNRRWHANFKGRTSGSREVVLIHRVAAH